MARTRKRPPPGRPHPVILQLELAAEMQGYTLRELTDADHISRQTWHGCLTGKHSPTLNTLETRANTLGYTVTLSRLTKDPQ